MKILMINSVCGIRSTGRICTDLAVSLEQLGHDVKIAYGRGNVPKEYQKYAIKIGGKLDVLSAVLQARLFDNAGFANKLATKHFIDWVELYDPDIIHLHNLHGYYIHVGILFDYLKKSGKPVIWTLHDCWSFTGHSAYFEYSGCTHWQTGCKKHNLKSEYPQSWFLDRAQRNYGLKQYYFRGLENLRIVTPSRWLSELVEKSLLSEYPVEVIPNGIDTTIFKKVNSKELIQKYSLFEKRVVLGVAAIWDKRKGLEEFIALSKQLPDIYIIVLIGLSKKQIKKLPPNILGIKETKDVFELVKWYNLADVFVNPTLEDNYPTTNLEAIACGTPVITYLTGGSPESAAFFGESVEKKDIQGLLEAIENCDTITPKRFNLDKEEMLRRYLELYSL